jgi:hypothetical protein
MTSASIPAVTTLRNSLSKYVFCVYNTIVLLIACFASSSPEVTFRIFLAIYNMFTLLPQSLSTDLERLHNSGRPFPPVNTVQGTLTSTLPFPHSIRIHYLSVRGVQDLQALDHATTVMASLHNGLPQN